MTVKERLVDLPPNQYIYLGSKHGSSWIWISYACELEDDIIGMNAKFFNSKQNSLQKVITKLAQLNIDLNKIIPGDLSNAQKAKIEKELSKSQKTNLQILRSTLQQTQEAYDYLTEYINNWHDLIDREIVEEYWHTSAPVGKALLIDGDEVGQFCVYEQVVEEKNKRKWLQTNVSERKAG